MNIITQEDTSWQVDAECAKPGVDPETFFSHDKEPYRARRARVVLAREICGRCVVKADCLNFALVNNEEFGIWGGLTEDERKPLKSSRQSVHFRRRVVR